MKCLIRSLEKEKTVKHVLLGKIVIIIIGQKNLNKFEVFPRVSESGLFPDKNKNKKNIV